MQVVYKNAKKETKSYFGFIVMCAILLSTTFVISAFMGKQYEKLYPVNDTVNGWTKTINGQEYLKQRIQQSDLPAKEVKFMIDSIIAPLQDLISKQVAPPYQAEQKRIQDSISKQQKPKG